MASNGAITGYGTLHLFVHKIFKYVSNKALSSQTTTDPVIIIVTIYLLTNYMFVFNYLDLFGGWLKD